jgi:alkanesulfonate monooxygenase SsuD/methylene tetrahydromethanopterin reductase-like flavin-dependent oxidoreductase (luciferase family)
MPFLWSAERLGRSKTWAARGRAKAPERSKLYVAHGLPTFVGDDIGALMSAARANLGLFAMLPYFQHLFRASGFVAEAENAEQGGGADALSDRLLDAVCLIGPVSRCRERLAEFTAAGMDTPILLPPVGVEAARAVIKAFKS